MYKVKCFKHMIDYQLWATKSAGIYITHVTVLNNDKIMVTYK